VVTGSSVRECCREKAAAEIWAIDKFRKAGGKTLGYLCSAFPEAVAAGLGMRPVRVLSFPPQQSIPVRPDICPLTGSLLSALCTRTGLPSMIDVWAGLFTCDQTRRLFQELPGYTGATVFHVQVPATRTGAAEQFYSAGIARLVDDVVTTGFAGAYDPEKALEWETGRRKAAAAVRELDMSGVLSPLELHCILNMRHVAEPASVISLASMMKTRGPRHEAIARVGIIGCPEAVEDDLVPAALEALGAGLVYMSCMAPWSPGPEEPLSGDPAELAAQAFRRLSCARCRPDDRMTERILADLAESGVKGVILKTQKFCDLWFTQKERLRAMLPVPVLVLDTTGGPGEEERVRTRIEAFLEALA
jgi:benzoyl-CoA reductase/2-hydroxyglutaryl-CoA dehydratase subunit BcrC/BadD/HgdB